MKHIRYMYICTFAWLFIFTLASSAQDTNREFAPTSGPAGTTIVIQCATGDEQVTLQPIPYSDADDFPRLDLDSSARIAITIPEILATATSYDVFCITDASDEFPNAFGTFTVLQNCPGLVNIPIGLTGTRVPQFSATDLRLNSNGRFVLPFDVQNNTGSVLRVIVRGDDPSQVLDYVNAVSVDFSVINVSQNQINGCNQRADLNFLSNNNPDRIISNNSDIDVELILVRAGVYTSNRPLNHVLFTIDPVIGFEETRIYHIDDALGATAKLDNVDGRIQLTMWNRPEGDYTDSLVYMSDIDYPALIHTTTEELNYLIVLEGLNSFNEYTLSGSFTIEDDCSVRECDNPSQPTISLLTNGVGQSNGATMLNGEFQVEYYCNGADVRVTETDWYCGSRQLDKDDFNAICRDTYSNDFAFAVNDDLNNQASYNWRCYGPS